MAGNPPAAGGDEERRRCRLREAGVTLADVFAQRGDGAVVQRDLALLVLLADADEDRAVSQVDVVAVERERLAGRIAVTASSPISV